MGRGALPSAAWLGVFARTQPRHRAGRGLQRRPPGDAPGARPCFISPLGCGRRGTVSAANPPDGQRRQSGIWPVPTRPPEPKKLAVLPFGTTTPPPPGTPRVW
jgi:hypothetical protein